MWLRAFQHYNIPMEQSHGKVTLTAPHLGNINNNSKTMEGGLLDQNEMLWHFQQQPCLYLERQDMQSDVITL